MKKIFISIFVFLVLSSFVLSDINEYRTACYDFEDLTDYYGDYDFTQRYGSSSFVSGVNDNAIHLTTTAGISASPNMFKYASGTFMYWQKLHGGSVNNYPINVNDGGEANTMYFQTFDNSIFTGLTYKYSDDVVFTPNTSMSKDVWNHIAYTYNQSDNTYRMYINGVEQVLTIGNDGDRGWGDHLGGTLVFAINFIDRTSDYTGYFNQSLDSMKVYNISLTETEIQADYNDGTGFNCEGTTSEPSTPPSMTLYTSLVNGTYGYLNNPTNYSSPNFIIDYTATELINTSEQANCTLYTNGSIYATTELTNISQPQQWLWNIGNGQFGMYFNLTCISNHTTAEILLDMFVDYVAPTLTNNIDTGDVFYKNVNASGWFSNVTYYDPNLFAINYTLYNPDGSVKHNNFTDSITEQTVIFTYVDDLEDDDLGDYSIFMQAWDDHTATEIKDYKIKETLFDGKKAYEIEDRLYIFGDDVKSIDFTKETDRYTFEIDFKDKNPYIELYSPNLVYRPNSGYTAHFVDVSLNKWVDFVTDVEGVQYQINEIDPHHYGVLIITDDTKLKFKSIGDLNYNSENITFSLSEQGANSVTYSNYGTYLGLDYARDLGQTVFYTCFQDNATLHRVINGTVESSITVDCGVTNATLSSYRHDTNGNYSISWILNNSVLSDTLPAQQFISDLVTPTIVYRNITTENAFDTSLLNVTALCIDNIMPDVFYNLTLGGAAIVAEYLANNTLTTNLTAGTMGYNNLTVHCSDAVSQANSTFNVYVGFFDISLINELTNAPLNLDNVTGAVAYYDENRTSYDFKAQNTTTVNFTYISNGKLRFRLEYSGGTVIMRYIDLALLSDTLRVCANPEGTTHYEQLVTSSSEKEALILNDFANCYIAADYTRFAYQDTKVLKAYSINTKYSLTTKDSDGDSVLLANIDGSISSYINIDTLEFQSEGYNIDISGDAVFISKRNENEMEVYYYNVEGDNTALRMQISRTDTNTELVDTSAFSDPNDAKLIYNYATLTGINDTTLFKVIVTKTNAAGDATIIKYFNTAGVTGSVSSGMIFILSIFMLIFGLTFTTSQSSLGWFGIILVLLNIALVSFAQSVWYITFMQGVNVVVLVFLVIVMVGKNQAGVAA